MDISSDTSRIVLGHLWLSSEIPEYIILFSARFISQIKMIKWSFLLDYFL